MMSVTPTLFKLALSFQADDDAVNKEAEKARD